MNANSETAPKSASLAVAIYQYRALWNDYLAKSHADDGTPAFYVPALKILENWRAPAEDWNAASEALSVALEIYEMGESEVIPAMMRAAKGFLEQDAKRRGQEDASPELLTAIDDAETTHESWLAMVPLDDDLPEDVPEEHAFNAAEKAFVEFPCRSLPDVHAKVSWLLSARPRTTATVVRSSVETCYMQSFLKSLIGLPAGKEV